MRGVLKVMEGDRKRFAALEKKYKLLQSEHNVLKRTYLNLLDGHIDIIDGKNKTIKRLRESKKAMKAQIVKDLNMIESRSEKEYFPIILITDVRKLKKKWDRND